MNENFDDSCLRVMRTANRAATLAGMEYVDYEHVAVALLCESKTVRKLLKSRGLVPDDICRILQAALMKGPEGLITMGKLRNLPTAQRLLELGHKLAGEHGQEKTAPLHIFLALLSSDFEGVAFQVTLREKLAMSFEELRECVFRETSVHEPSQRTLKGKKAIHAGQILETQVRSIAEELGFRPIDFEAFARAVGEPDSNYRRELLSLMGDFICQDAPL